MGIIKFCVGTMCSGKSLRLLATAHNFQEHNIPFLLMKSEIDNRDGENVIHSRALGDKPCVTISKDENILSKIESCYKDLRKLQYVLIDEVQFLSVQQIDEIVDIADTYGITFYCYGLKTDFKTKLFPASQRLFEVCDEIETIDYFCKCGKKAMFNARVDKDGNIVTSGKQIEVGGDDRYVALCRECFYNKVNCQKNE